MKESEQKTPEQKISEQEINKYSKEATRIANFLQDPDKSSVKVAPGDGWKFNPENGVIYFPPEDLSANPDKRIVTLGHEIGHMLYDTPEAFELINEHPEANTNKKEAAELINGVRDLAINDKLSSRFVGFKERVTNVYQQEAFPKSFFSKENQEKIPPRLQFIYGFIYQHYNQGEIPPHTRKEVDDAINKIIKSKKLKMAINAYTASLSYKRILDDIWPIYYKLFKDQSEPLESPTPPSLDGNSDDGGNGDSGEKQDQHEKGEKNQKDQKGKDQSEPLEPPTPPSAGADGAEGVEHNKKQDQSKEESKGNKEGKDKAEGKKQEEKKLEWREGMKVKDKSTGKEGEVSKVNSDGSVEVSFN